MGQGLLQLLLLQALATDPIVIETNAPDPALAGVTIASCAEPRGAGSCRGAADPGASAGWFATVVWEDEPQRRARIEIRRGSPGARPEFVRVVEFSAEDELEQRHRAVGLIIASYVAERTGEREPPPPPPRPPDEPERVEPERDEPDARAQASGPPRAGMDLALLAGTALDRGAPRFGLTLRGFVRPWEVPLAPTLALRAARRFEGPELVFASGAAGLLARMEAAPKLALELRGELVAERMQARAEDPLTRVKDEGGEWRLGGQLGLELHLAAGGPIALFAGGDVHLLLPAVAVDIGGEETGRARTWGAAGLLGVRLAH